MALLILLAFVAAVLVALLPPVFRWDEQVIMFVVGSAVNVARRVLGG